MFTKKKKKICSVKAGELGNLLDKYGAKSSFYQIRPMEVDY